ncbi:MAG: response regulator transcription factor [Betaproteobacteria bacterium]|nr:response regulator transcription factor [Betaproteobacteria bacterium]MDE2621831.1 response regulator transcription factor [Betaproteobacteria bacterium]
MSTFVLMLENNFQEAFRIRKALNLEGFELVHCTAAEEAQTLLRQFRFRLALVDLAAEAGGGGLDFVRHARESQPNLGIMVMSTSNTVADRIIGYQVGADDYLPKPFDAHELGIRARRLAQRVHPSTAHAEGTIFQFCGFTLDKRRRMLFWRDQGPVPLTGREFELLLCLVESENRVVARDTLAGLVCGRPWQAHDRSVDVMVSSLRRKLRAVNPKEILIRSIRGAGYCFGARVETLL